MASRLLPIRLLALSLLLVPSLLGALDVRSYKIGRDFITEGGMDQVDWFPAGLATMCDYANYNQWALEGLDGKDVDSVKFWENFKDYVFQAPDIMVIKLSLNLPWPIGKVPAEVKFRIDESQLANNQLTLSLIERPSMIESAVLSLAGSESPTTPGTMQVHFRISLRFDPVVEMLLNMESLNIHMRIVVGRLAGNLEKYSLARSRAQNREPAAGTAGDPAGSPPGNPGSGPPAK